MEEYPSCNFSQEMFRDTPITRCVTIFGAQVMLRYVDEAILPPFWKWIARTGAPIAAILIPTAFFLSVASPSATEPNGLINLAYVGALFLAASVLSLGIGLIRAARLMDP